MEKTLILLKPDTIQRGLVGNIISRFENKGFQLVAIKMINMSNDMINQHYSHIRNIPTYQEIADYMSSGPIIAMCWQGLDVIDTARKLCGSTNARNAKPGTIRGDFGMSIQKNLIHVSDSKESAKNEVQRFFDSFELNDHITHNIATIYSKSELK
jgi:nucleoside-diphosphate kinase